MLASGKENLSHLAMRHLNNLRAIQAFEATARNGSYVGAAAELHITPAAVGQQVRALESWLGVALFRRLDSGSQRLVLTDTAQAALPDFRDGLDLLHQGLRRLRDKRGRTAITVTASQAFVSKWLLPRLDAFTALQPDIDVRLDVSDRLVDVAHGEADVGVRCGPGRWPGLVAHHLMDEEVFPVCTPTVAATGAWQRVSELAKQTLIHDATMKTEGVFPTWQTWLRFAGVNGAWAERGLKINASAAVIQAVLNHQGIALARRVLVHDDLVSGRLVRLFPNIQWPIAWGYYVVHRAGALDQAPIDHFVRWLGGSICSSNPPPAGPASTR
jgi:LysR family transcriptional regulator, glycine cleavage system transcriptional activator